MQEPVQSTFLARIALEWKLIGQDQLNACLKEQEQARAKGKEILLGQLLVDRGWLKAADLERILGEQRERLARAPGLTRYELRQRIAEGATAVVYLAWDRELDRSVALKLLREEVSLDPTGRARFQRELEAMRRLSHPNVVAVYDGGEASGRFFIVMEVVKGRTLKELLKLGHLHLKEFLVLMEKVSRGVGAAHEHGIIHRDLKPSNILIPPLAEPKVADFGLSRIPDFGTAVTKPGVISGTPRYMAPEQLTGKETTPRTDVFALGILLYEGLTGVPPHAGRSDIEAYRKTVMEPAVPLSQLNANVSKPLEELVLKALAKSPDQRHPDATALAEDLHRYLHPPAS
jgi:eukaryotic-like serine/threonine-protein kinase